MARWGNKAAVVLCVDVGFAMSNSFPGEESPFELAKKVITMFVQRQVFAESKDEIALVLLVQTARRMPSLVRISIRTSQCIDT